MDYAAKVLHREFFDPGVLTEMKIALTEERREAAHEKQMPFVARWKRLYVRAVKGAGGWRSLERSGNP
jgi:hypothetical protein